MRPPVEELAPNTPGESLQSMYKVIGLTIREPTICSLISRVQQEHQRHAQQQVTGTNSNGPTWAKRLQLPG